MKTQQYAFVGNGTIFLQMAKGMLKAGFSPEDMLVIKRETSKRNIDFCNDHNIQVSNNITDVKPNSMILPVVKPAGSGYVVQQLRLLERSQCQEVISFVSGMKASRISEALNGFSNITRATCNTNIAYGKDMGIICATNYSPFLASLAKLFVESSNRLLRSIVTVGSMNAFDCLALILIWQDIDSVQSLREWLEGVLYNKDSNLVATYLKTKSIVFRNSNFRYFSSEVSLDRSKLTMESTIKSLLSFDEEITVETIKGLQELVVTEGGCTERGINKITTVEQLLSTSYLEEVFDDVWEGAAGSQSRCIAGFRETSEISIRSLLA